MSIGGHTGRTCALVMTLCAWLFAGCNLNPFFLGAAGDGGTLDGDGGGRSGIDAGDGGGIDAGTPDADMSDVDAGCVQTAANDPCDTIDNDCDGMIDEDTNLDTDPGNCGACGIRCALLGASGECTAGTCGNFACNSGHVDINGDLGMAMSDGCEYACLPSNGGDETCDFTDNDCDFIVDEGFGGDTDVNNCGGCGIQCNILNAVEECVGGQCGFSDCETGFADIFSAVPGCEYQCPVFPIEGETCNNIDDDCDGVIDNGASGGGLGAPCTNPGFETQADTGLCEFGAVVCSAGSEVCGGYVGPQAEICNNEDDDCDGGTDENFDRQNDPNNCGTGCVVCELDNAFEGCTAGVCSVAGCELGFVDLNGMPGDGCEYACVPTGPEVCDGRDNDCDGLTDDADNVGPTVFVPAPANFCASDGACAGVTPICAANPCDTNVPPVITFQCPYAGNSEADNCFVLPLQEAACDGFDGDCDGFVDESFINLGDACDNGAAGACRGTGLFECTGDTIGTICVIDTPGLTATASELFCDNIDEDCDGITDEGAPDSVVGIDNNADGMPDFFIDAYEASRPDATIDNVGGAEHRACSTPGVLPWTNTDYVEAETACVAAGKRLCTEAEWELACAGTAGDVYPYGNSYLPNACNGNDFDLDCGVGADEDEALATGFTYGCPTPLLSCEQTEWSVLTGNTSGTFDMSGNVKEWTSTVVGGSARRIRGGAYDSSSGGLTCDFDFVSASETFFFTNLGFRCCSN